MQQKDTESNKLQLAIHFRYIKNRWQKIKIINFNISSTKKKTVQVDF